MIGMGLFAAIGLLFTFWKLSWRLRIKLLSYPVTVDLAIAGLLFVTHGGTFSGGMVAASAALFCSLALSLLRWLFGYEITDPQRGRLYKKGVFDKYDAIYGPNTHLIDSNQRKD